MILYRLIVCVDVDTPPWKLFCGAHGSEHQILGEIHNFSLQRKILIKIRFTKTPNPTYE